MLQINILIFSNVLQLSRKQRTILKRNSTKNFISENKIIHKNKHALKKYYSIHKLTKNTYYDNKIPLILKKTIHYDKIR